MNPNEYDYDDDDIEEIVDSVVWKKLESITSYRPACKESHSLASVGPHHVATFGGYESGQRVNSIAVLNVANGEWRVPHSKGDPPLPRSLHASTGFNNIVLVHGGDGVLRDSNDTRGGLCPGDSISILPKNKSNTISSGDTISSLDDFYAFNMGKDIEQYKGTWVKLVSSLAPLPRSGHTLTTLKVDEKQLILLFGGYSRETSATSNSIHICFTDDIIKYLHDYENIPKYNSSGIQNNVKPITWRTLKCHGKLPIPRHRHSASIIKQSNVQYLAIYGGINSNNEILNDLCLLDLVTYNWTTIISNSTNQIMGSISPSPMYGHCSFPIPKYVKIDENDTLNNNNSSSTTDSLLLIFGGTNNISQASTGCYSDIICFDPTTSEWSKPSTGFVFPSERCNHSCSVVYNYTPGNPLPSHISGSSNNNENNNENKLCAVIFGGCNSFNVLNDVWILDLMWRPRGIQQYDHTAEKRLLSQSKSLPMLSTFKSTNGSSNNQFFSASGTATSLLDDPENNKVFHKLRKERAQKDLLLISEKEKINLFEQKELKYLNEIEELKAQIQSLTTNYDKEITELKNELEQKNDNIVKLKELNEEMKELLYVSTIKNFTI